jgi:hypothetical protein
MKNDLAAILKRIDRRLKEIGKTANAASKEAGKPDAIRNLRRAVKGGAGRQGIGTGTIEALAMALDTRPAWLLTGEEPVSVTERQVVPVGQEFPPDPDPDEPATLGGETGARGIPADGSAQVDVTLGLGAGGITIVRDGVPGKRGMTFAAEHVADYWRIPPATLASFGRAKPGDIAIFPVQGNSMEPTLTEGDCVFVDTRHRLPSPDGLYALADEFGGIVVKRLELASDPGDEDPMVRIISDNPRHKPKEWHLSQTRIIGRIVRKFGVVK